MICKIKNNAGYVGKKFNFWLATQSLMKSIHIIPIIIILATSCSEKDLDIPAEMIPRDSMIEILADVHIAESRLIQDGYKPNNQVFKSEYIQHVLNKDGVDSTRFNKSFLFYSAAPGYFQDMYEDVITEISKKQAKARVDSLSLSGTKNYIDSTAK